MTQNYELRKRRTFISFFVFLNAIYLFELLPSLGYTLPSMLSSRRLLLMLTAVALFVLVSKHTIRKDTTSTLFFIMCVYCLGITLFNNGIQQQPLYYYLAAVLYPWVITFIMEDMACDIDKWRILNMSKTMALSGIIYVVLMSIYKLNRVSFLTASGEASIYFIITLLPFVLCCKEKVRNFLLIMTIVSVFITLKRTALIAVIISLLVYLFVRFKNKDEHKFRLVLYGIAVLIIIVIAYQLVVQYTGNDLLAKLLDTQEDGGSNRDIIYHAVIEKFLSLGLGQKLLGVGYNGVRYSYNIVSAGSVVSAHNDFLEVLCDYGIIGFILYIWIIIKQIKSYLYLRRIESELAPAMAASIVLFFVLSTFSHLILYTSYFMNILVFWVLIECYTKNVDTDLGE